MFSIETSGSFKFIEAFFKTINKKAYIMETLRKYGQKGVDALSSNTPVDSGRTSEMWGYEIHESKDRYEIVWTNDNINDGIPIALLIQFGHGTRNGAYVQGIDYINPAIAGIFEGITQDVWEEVQSK